MENKQDRRGTKKKQGENSLDLRQMDLWTEASRGSVAAPAAARANDAKTVAQPSVVAEKAGSDKAVRAERSPAVPAPRSGPASAPVPASSPSVPAVAAASPAARSHGGMPALTRRQLDLLDYLRDRVGRGLRPPSLTEICRDLRLVSRGSLHKQIVALVEAGLVEPMRGKQRGVRLVAAANDSDGASVPLLGAIAAGKPIEALTRDETVALPAWLRGADNCFALRVKGDSMRDVGILDGDVVIVEPREHARNGETVVALIDEAEATLKRIEQRPGMVVLHAENPAFAPQRYEPERVRIQGVVVAQLRRYRL